MERDEESLAQNRRLPRLEVSARPEEAIADSGRLTPVTIISETVGRASGQRF